MIDHHLQRAIVRKLTFSEGLRFADLQPDGLENKLFTYHLHKLETAGYITKNEQGIYHLTAEGKRLGIRMSDRRTPLADVAESVLFLAVQRKSDDAWLLYKRLTHPMRGLLGFMHCTPEPGTKTQELAAQQLHEQTGLTGSFTPRCSGFFRVYNGDELESFTNFTLLFCEDPAGNLESSNSYAEYAWSNQPDFSSKEMLPNMALLTSTLERPGHSFIDEIVYL